MITIDEQLKVTKQLNTIACRYAQKVLIKDFLLKFTFPNCSDEKHNYDEENINPLLETLNFHQGEIYPDTFTEVNDFIYDFIKNLEESDLTSLYCLVLNKNYFKYYDDFIDNEGSGLDDELIDIEFGRFLAAKIYNPIESELQEDLVKFLTTTISSYSDDVDVSMNDDYPIEGVLRCIDAYSIEKITI